MYDLRDMSDLTKLVNKYFKGKLGHDLICIKCLPKSYSTNDTKFIETALLGDHSSIFTTTGFFI